VNLGTGEAAAAMETIDLEFQTATH
jgi:hypothetical protein